MTAEQPPECSDGDEAKIADVEDLLAVPLDWAPLMSKAEAREIVKTALDRNRTWLVAGIAYASMDAPSLLKHLIETNRRYPCADDEAEDGEVMNLIKGIEEQQKAHEGIAEMMSTVHMRMLCCAAHIATESEAARQYA